MCNSIFVVRLPAMQIANALKEFIPSLEIKCVDTNKDELEIVNRFTIVYNELAELVIIKNIKRKRVIDLTDEDGNINMYLNEWTIPSITLKLYLDIEEGYL